MKRRAHSTHQEDMMHIIEAWKVQGGVWPAPASDIADFAVRNHLFNATAGLRRLCARELARAMREEYITDGRGRSVRRLHAARFKQKDGTGKQLTLWADIDTADPEHMEVSFQQRRQQIVGDCFQLRNDVAYFNSRHPERKPMQMIFDFTRDVIERDLSGEYDPAPED